MGRVDRYCYTDKETYLFERSMHVFREFKWDSYFASAYPRAKCGQINLSYFQMRTNANLILASPFIPVYLNVTAVSDYLISTICTNYPQSLSGLEII